MNFLNLISIICVLAAVSVILKKYALEYSLFINILLGIIVIFYISAKFLPILSEIKNLISLAKIPEKYCSILFKSLGICLISQFASDSCKDAGETALASKIEIIGKLGIVSVSLPLFEEVIKTALKLMGTKGI